MKEGGFDRLETNELEMGTIFTNDDYQPPLLNPSTDITQHTTDFTTTSTSSWRAGVESDIDRTYKEEIMDKYEIDENSYRDLRKKLRIKERKLYFVGKSGHNANIDVLIEDTRGGVYKPTSALGPNDSKVGVSNFDKTIKKYQRETLERRSQALRGNNLPPPLETTVINRQPITFNNPAFDDEVTQRLTNLRTINADLEAAGEPPLDTSSLMRTRGVPLATLREIIIIIIIIISFIYPGLHI